MINEHDLIVLTEDLAGEKLQVGDIGTVVHVHKNGAGYEVEFMTLSGETIMVVTLMSTQVRPATSREIPHARELVAA